MISKILNTTATKFKTIFGKADNRLIFAADLNSVIDQLNSILAYRFYDVIVTQTDGLAPVATMLINGGTGTSCTGPCNSNVEDCCKETTSRADIGFTFKTPVYNGTGDYTFELNANPLIYPAGIKASALFVSNLTDPAHKVTVERIYPGGQVDITKAVFTVKTYDGDVEANNILNKTVISSKTYFN